MRPKTKQFIVICLANNKLKQLNSLYSDILNKNCNILNAVLLLYFSIVSVVIDFQIVSCCSQRLAFVQSIFESTKSQIC